MSLAFNSDSDQQDLVSEIKRICGTDTSSYPLKDMARRCNMALDRFTFLAATANGMWDFDDSNNTSLPIGTTSLVSGQQDYQFASDVLIVEKVICKDRTGIWIELTPITDDDTSNTVWTNPTSGTPSQYAKFGNSILLDPKPNYASASGLQVVFQRAANHFASTATTAVAGIPHIFDGYIARYASQPFLEENGIENKNDNARNILRDEDSIQKFFAFRPKDNGARLAIKQESNR